MDVTRYSRLTIELHNSEIETMREIARLAHEYLNNSKMVRMPGSPLEGQAGLVGPELYRVKSMLEELGEDLGIDLPFDAEPYDNTEVNGDPSAIGMPIVTDELS